MSQAHGRKVLWIHVSPQSLPRCVEMGLTSIRYISTETQTAVGLLKSTDADIVVLDGYRSSELSHMLLLPYLFPRDSNRTDVLVSSTAGLSSSCIEEYLLRGISFFDSGSWTVEEYKQASADPEFLRSVLPNLKCGQGQDLTVFNANLDSDSLSQMIYEKYFYVGGCARWMFAMPHKMAMFHIHACLECVDDYRVLLERRRGIRTQDYCNHLLVSVEGRGSCYVPQDNFVFVSSYVARLVLSKCKLPVIRSAYELADVRYNPAFLGWVFEFDFIARLALASQAPDIADKIMDVYATNGAIERWMVPGICEFVEFSLFQVKRQLNDGHWLRLKDWNEAGYDLVCLTANDDGSRTLRFVQITRGSSHSMNLTYFDNLATSVHALIGNDLRVDVVVLSPCGWGNTHLPPRIRVTGSGLSKWRVISGETHWPAQPEASHIRYLAFHPCNMAELRGNDKAVARGRKRGRRRGLDRPPGA